ncbi:hypothetical protein QL093DRAFT_2541981 [Fusarium oxysporum]|nr:hypothetical protein QL093DRAFT_2541981 [Fusarium oxysporum]
MTFSDRSCAQQKLFQAFFVAVTSLSLMIPGAKSTKSPFQVYLVYKPGLPLQLPSRFPLELSACSRRRRLVSSSSYTRSHINSARDRYLNASGQLRRTRPQAAQSETSSDCLEGASYIQTYPLLAEDLTDRSEDGKDMEKYIFDQTTFASLQLPEQASRNLLGQCLPGQETSPIFHDRG